MRGDDRYDRALVIAARDGDQQALDRLVAAYLPLVYNVVGRALDAHADVDDVVQETMLRCVTGLPGLREPERFRAWLVAIAVHQVRDRYRARQAAREAYSIYDNDVSDPGADFADLTILRLELSGQRREVADATRWLDPDDRELLSLWWLEASGELTRGELALSLGITNQHAAVRVQRMKGQLDAARVVVRALHARPTCPELSVILAGWSGRPDPLWRKRIARHTRECGQCAPVSSRLVSAERLLAGVGMVAPPAVLAQATGASTAGALAGAAPAVSKAAALLPKALQGIALAKPVAAAAATVAVAASAIIGYGLLRDPGPAPASTSLPGAVSVTSDVPSSTPTPTVPAPTPTVAATPSPTRTATKAAPPVTPSKKKGAAVWEFPAVSAGLKAVGASWYYNWGPSNDRMPGPSGVEFVPMIWGQDNVTDSTLATAKREGKVLLGFNEPDLAEQSNMSVQKALELWPRLEATGLRLGSPAVAWGAADEGRWLDQFMAGAKQRGLRVDFIALHWYGSDFSSAAVGHLRGYIQQVYQKYKLPIWLTEFALIKFEGGAKYPSDAQQAAFVDGATDMLQSLSYVERYSWFGLPSTPDSGTGLYKENGVLTAAGKAYRAAG